MPKWGFIQILIHFKTFTGYHARQIFNTQFIYKRTHKACVDLSDISIAVHIETDRFLCSISGYKKWAYIRQFFFV